MIRERIEQDEDDEKEKTGPYGPVREIRGDEAGDRRQEA